MILLETIQQKYDETLKRYNEAFNDFEKWPTTVMRLRKEKLAECLNKIERDMNDCMENILNGRGYDANYSR